MVTADYLGLLGIKTATKLDFVVAQFKTIDMETGAPIFGSRVKCQQKGYDNACTLKDIESDDVLSILFPKQTIVTKTHLFVKNEELILPENPDIYIFFINKDYETVNMTLPIIDILNSDTALTKVKMKARKW